MERSAIRVRCVW